MAQAGKGRLNYRCPSCFMRDLDIDMFYDEDKKEYYCIRCQYTGTEEDVLAKNELVRFRYTNGSAVPDNAIAVDTITVFLIINPAPRRRRCGRVHA